MRLRISAVVAVVAVMVGGSLALAAPVSAHVTVSAPGAMQGGDAVVTFTVPTESDTLSTVGLTVQLPQATPLADVLALPHPGWTYTSVKGKLATPIATDDGTVTEAVTEVAWRAQAGNGIKPGEFGQFVLSVGPLPKVPTLTFRALQTYSDGSVVRWIDVPAPGSTAEPEHPAPTLQLAPASGGSASASAAASGASSGGVTVSATPAAASSSGSQTGAVVVSVIALVIAIVAALVGLVALRDARRRRT
jgi:periplasmic copper chaperone A